MFSAGEDESRIKDLFNARVEYNVTWNTKLLAGAKACANTEAAGQILNNIAPNAKEAQSVQRWMKAGLTAVNKVFAGQGMNWEVSFNGYQDIMEAAVFEVAMPMFEKEKRREAEYYGGEVDEASFYFPLPQKPAEDQVKAIIEAVGNIGGKTIRNLIDEGVNVPAIIPGEAAAMGIGQALPMPLEINAAGFYTPLGMLKLLIQSAPAPPPLKQLALGLLDVIYGVKAIKASSTLAVIGLEARGMDVFAPLPTGGDIMSAPEGVNAEASASIMSGDPSAAFEHVSGAANFYMRFAAQEACAAVDAGMIPPQALPVPPPMMEKLKAMTVTDEELAEFQEKWSEIIDVLKAVWPLVKDIEPPEPDMAPMKDYAVAVFTKLTGIA